MIIKGNITQIDIFTHTFTERKLNEGNNVLKKNFKFPSLQCSRLKKQQKAVQNQSYKEIVS